MAGANEINYSVVQGIQHIKDWIAKEPHLPQDIEDTWLESFLHGCKDNVERCKEFIDTYYTTRTLYPQYFTNRDPTSEKIRLISKHQFYILLPGKSSEGYQIAIMGFLNTDPSGYDAESDLKKYLLIIDTLYRMNAFEIIIILDSKDYTLSHANKLLPYLPTFVSLMLNKSLLRIKQIHVLNMNPFARALVSAVLPLLKEKIRKRFNVHSNVEELYKTIPRELLPKEYGGESGTLSELNDSLQKKLEDMRDWFLSDEKRKTDESKRDKSTLQGEMFGTEGTFRRLQID